MTYQAVAPERTPLTILLVFIGLAGGAAGGTLVGIAIAIWSAFGRAGANLLAVFLGAMSGAIVGTAMGIAAALLRLIVAAIGGGLTAQLVVVATGTIVVPIALLWTGGPGFVAFGAIVGGLAAIRLCLTTLKRYRADAPVVGI